MKEEKWYFKTYVFVIALLCIGPFALPLMWFNPHFNLKMKVIVSIIVIVLSYYIAVAFSNSLKNLYDYYKQLSL